MEKQFVDVTYPIKDISDGLISKGMAVRHYENLNPEHQVLAISSFKIDHEAETISIRVRVQPKPVGVNRVVLFDAKPYGQKLLNPGYDELKKKFDDLYALHSALCEDYTKVQEERNVLQSKLVTADETYEGLRAAHAKLLKEYDELSCIVAHATGDDLSDTDTNTFNEAVAKACDQADVIGPDDEGDDGND